MCTLVYHSLHAMLHHHESKYLHPEDKPTCSHLHAQEVHVDLPVMLIVDLSFARVV